MSTLRVPVTDRDHAVGPADATVTLVEYGDYQCPYCGAAYPVVKALREQYGDRLRFVFRNFPLAEIHPEAVDAAVVAEFAADHGRFWAAHDLLFENQRDLGPALYRRICDQLGLPYEELKDGAEIRTDLARVSDDERGGIRSGVNGTPTFFLDGVRVDAGTAGLADALARVLGAPRG